MASGNDCATNRKLTLPLETASGLPMFCCGGRKMQIKDVGYGKCPAEMGWRAQGWELCSFELLFELGKVFAQTLHLFGQGSNLIFELRDSFSGSVSGRSSSLCSLHLSQSFQIQFAT